ncbi:hypothetical protein [Colwellia polaris]|jgi:hypothetical protein|uniref:hypothetical protein n=1 Tax=Colwellia polaris TaxID=326537 RepID=UPI000A1765B1|nr:hypothetical protein [Colwellia polaris]
MSLAIEPLSFLEIARRELSNDFKSTDQLPDPIRNCLNTIFTKKANANLYRPKVINEKVIDQKQNKHPLKLGTKHFVYNVLVIWYLFNSETGKTKSLLQEYAKFGICDGTLNELIELTKKQYLEFFCLGVIRENVQQIIELLKSHDFDLFTKKLPSPFSSNKSSDYDISPMLAIYSEDIPWESYMTQYQLAEDCFENKDYVKAKQTLVNLEAIAVIRLPVIESLNKKINAVELETKEAWDYFQNILN